MRIQGENLGLTRQSPCHVLDVTEGGRAHVAEALGQNEIGGYLPQRGLINLIQSTAGLQAFPDEAARFAAPDRFELEEGAAHDPLAFRGRRIVAFRGDSDEVVP